MRKIDVKQTALNLEKFIKDCVYKAGFKKMVVAVSGGVDSATTISLAVRALGKENVFALLLPYKDRYKEGTSRAEKFLINLNLHKENIFKINIKSAVATITDLSLVTYHLSPESKIRLGNIMARVRMILLYDFAKKHNALVLGTENKSEYLLGYFTRFGDEASDIEPLRSLYKTEVYWLAKYLGVTKEIIAASPTAGLWQGQTDEGEFGFTYKEADEILFAVFDEKKSAADLIKRGFSKTAVKKVLNWVKKVDFKHHLPLLAPEPVIK